MTEIVGLTPAEHHVLHEADGHALLWELAAGWTGNDDQDQRIEAVPVLVEALVSLVGQGLVEVHAFPSWPMTWDDALAIPADQIAREVGAAEHWLYRDDATSLIAVTITEAGGRWL